MNTDTFQNQCSQACYRKESCVSDKYMQNTEEQFGLELVQAALRGCGADSVHPFLQSFHPYLSSVSPGRLLVVLALGDVRPQRVE